jgi:hypothetical protein
LQFALLGLFKSIGDQVERIFFLSYIYSEFLWHGKADIAVATIPGKYFHLLTALQQF